MRLAAAATAERLIPKNRVGVFLLAGRRNEEPLTLPDRTAAFRLGGAKTLNRGPHIVNTVTGHRGGEPVTLIMAEQELILVCAVPNHQHQMARIRPYIKNLGDNPVLTANIEEFAITIPAHINSDFFSLPHTRTLDFQACAHAGEMPTQRLCSRHKLLQFLGLG
jgi:hypothetical protein